MLQTAWGSLYRALQLKPGESLLVRGGTTSVGLAAAAIAKIHGAKVASTTRNAGRTDLLKQYGAEEVFVDDGTIEGQVRGAHPEGFDKVLEMIGTTTLKDSLKCAKEHGIVCMTGIVGNSWAFQEFAPMEAIPGAVYLTIYDGGPKDFMATPLAQLAEQIKAGKLSVKPGKVFRLDEIVEAHRMMDSNSTGGKIVVLT